MSTANARVQQQHVRKTRETERQFLRRAEKAEVVLQ